MTDKEISSLTAATTPLDGTEIIHVEQSSNSRKVAVSEIAALVTGAMLKSTYDPDNNGIIAVAQGGTNAATASAARTNLGLGTMAVQNASSVAITGGTMSGVSVGWSNITTTPTTLSGYGITDAQPLDSDLTAIAAVSTQAYGRGLLAHASEAAFKAGVNLEIGTDVQAYDALLQSIASLTVASGDIIYGSGVNTVSRLPIGSNGQVLKVSGGSLAWGTTAGAGDMLESVYDPTGVGGDAFDQDNMVDGTTNKNYTATEQTKLAGIEALADVTDATNVAAAGAAMTANNLSDVSSVPTSRSNLSVPAYVDDLTALKALPGGADKAAKVLSLGDFEWDAADHTSDEDGYSVVKADDMAISAGAWIRRFNRPPRPADFGGNNGTALDRVMVYAARNSGEVEFDGVFPLTGDLDLDGSLHYSGTSTAVFDGSARTDTLGSDFLRGSLKFSGSAGTGVSIAADLDTFAKFSITGITRSGTTNTATTARPHGLVTGDYAWVIWPGGYTSLPTGAYYFTSSQGLSTEQLPLLLPVQVTVTGTRTFTYTVTPAGGPASTGSGFIGWKDDRTIRTAAAHGLSVGDWVELSSDRTVPAVSGYQPVPYGEVAQVSRVPTSTVAVLDRPVKWGYLVSDNAVFKKLALPSGSLRGVTIIGRGSTGTPNNYDGDTGLSLDYLDRFVLEDVKIRQCAYLGMTVHRFNNLIIDRPDIYVNLTDDAGRTTGVTKEAYGIAYGSWFEKLSINDAMVLGNHRHGIAEATSSAYAGVSGVAEFNNPTVVGATSNCMASHYPNDGVRVMGGFLSGNEYGIDHRGGKLHIEGTRGRGGWGMVNAYGFCNDTVIKDVLGGNYASAMVKVAPTDGSAYTPATIVIDGVRCDGATYAVHVASANTSYAMDCRVRRVQANRCEYYPVYITSPSSKPGTVEVSGVSGTNCNQSNDAALYGVVLSYMDRVRLSDINVAPSGSQVNYGYQLTSCTNVTLGENIIRTSTPLESLTVAADGSIDVSGRADDFAAVVRGAGGSADNLDFVKGLREGQRITLFRYSETITIRDGQASPPTGAQAIQTPGSTSIVLSSAYHLVTIVGVNNSSPTSSGGIVYPIVEVNRTDT